MQTQLDQCPVGMLVVENPRRARVGELAPGELPPEMLDLGTLIEMLADPAFDIESEYQRVFGLVMSKQCPPYETEYYRQTFSVFRSQMLTDIAGFYSAFGLEPSRDRPDRQDHISLELEFMAWLIAATSHPRREGDSSGAEICLEAQRRFFGKHLGLWAPAFAFVLRRRADDKTRGVRESSFYAALADALAALIHVDRLLLGISPPNELGAPRRPDDVDAGSDEGCAAAGSLPVINPCGAGCAADD
jgi:TorA maturation chaperone TorD